MCGCNMKKRKRIGRTNQAVTLKVNDPITAVKYITEGAVGFGLSNTASAKILETLKQTNVPVYMLVGVKVLLTYLTYWVGSQYFKEYKGDFVAFAAGMGLSGALDLLSAYLPPQIKTAIGIAGIPQQIGLRRYRARQGLDAGNGQFVRVTDQVRVMAA